MMKDVSSSMYIKLKCSSQAIKNKGCFTVTLLLNLTKNIVLLLLYYYYIIIVHIIVNTLTKSHAKAAHSVSVIEISETQTQARQHKPPTLTTYKLVSHE